MSQIFIQSPFRVVLKNRPHDVTQAGRNHRATIHDGVLYVQTCETSGGVEVLTTISIHNQDAWLSIEKV